MELTLYAGVMPLKWTDNYKNHLPDCDLHAQEKANALMSNESMTNSSKKCKKIVESGIWKLTTSPTQCISKQL